MTSSINLPLDPADTAPGCGDRVGAYEAAMARALGDEP
jgi:hypothetical protein